MIPYSFNLRPEDHQPSGHADFSRINNVTLQNVLTSSSLNFDDMYDYEFKCNRIYFKEGSTEFKRKYINDFTELRDFIGWNNFEMPNNELTIIHARKLKPNVRVYAQNYNVLRIMSGMSGLAYSS
mgnify:FL=1